jgi:hypothetical protein
MQDTAGSARNVLAYLRDMVEYCKEKRRQDLQWEYEEAVELLSSLTFGELPPRKPVQLPGYEFHQPANPQIPSGFRPGKLEMPLRRIVQSNPRPHGWSTVTWETLECGHELLAPPGHNNPVKRRRCIYCAFAAVQAVAKKPSSSVAIARKKAVGA